MSKVDFHHHDKLPSWCLSGFLFGATITAVVGMTRLNVSQRSSNLVLSVDWPVLGSHGHGQQRHDLLLEWHELTWIPVWHQHTFSFCFLYNAGNPALTPTLAPAAPSVHLSLQSCKEYYSIQ
jgi:hypothetical protein